MKHFVWPRCNLISHAFKLFIITLLLGGASLRAGLTVDIHLYHDTFGYYFYPYLSANATPPDFPTGIYQIASPQIPTNGSRLVYQATPGNISECYNNDCGGGNYYGDFDSFVYGITNGLWTISVTNATSTNLYFFSVKVTGLTSNVFGPVTLPVYPAYNAVGVSAQPQFQWSGPLNWAGTLSVQDYSVDTNGNYTYVASDSLDPSATTWTPSVSLPLGTNSFSLYYSSNITALVTASQPTNHAGAPISGWLSGATMETDFAYGVNFTVGQSTTANDFDPFLVARYDFENTNTVGADSSGNGNDSNCGSNSGTNNDTFSTDAAIGNYARLFFGDTSFCFYPGDPSYLNLSNALSGNFTVSAWVNTTNSFSDNYANAYFGMPVFFSGADYNNDCTIPLSITGGKAAFTIVSSNGPGTITLHSTTTVSDGKYHLLTATRQQSTGLMSLYVDGNLEATGTGITDPVVTQGYISIAGGYYTYTGLLDDVRLYSTNLSAADVEVLEAKGGLTFGDAVGATNLAFTTTGDAKWFIESTNTVNGSPFALQSGSITNNQSTLLTATVMGPGKLTFQWSSIANDPNEGFDYEFYIDDPYTNDIADLYGTNPWQSIANNNNGNPINIPPGLHTLGWIVYANGDTDPSQAAFLDQVSFAPPGTGPVSASITVDIYREQDPTFGEIYIAFPAINSITPDGEGTTTNVIQSPTGDFSGHMDQGGSGESSSILFSYNQLVNDLTNGQWTLFINKGLASERQLKFTASLTGLDTNVLSAVKLITPTNGATGISATTSFQWLGPSNYNGLSVYKQNNDGSDRVGTSLPVTATFWPSPPALDAGSNQFNVSYASNNFPGLTFTVPIDAANGQAAASWTTSANLNSIATAVFVVAGGPAATKLLGPQDNGTNFQFSFQSQSGSTNTIQYRTNLVVGSWQVYSNVVGDGTLKNILIPLSVFNNSKQGFVQVISH